MAVDPQPSFGCQLFCAPQIQHAFVRVYTPVTFKAMLGTLTNNRSMAWPLVTELLVVLLGLTHGDHGRDPGTESINDCLSL